MRRQRSILLRVFLALLFAFAQQQAVRHALVHDVERIHASKDAGTGEAFCAKCLAVAHLDHVDGVAAIPPIVAFVSPGSIEAALPASAVLAFVGAYRSRAPPVFS